MVVSGGTVGDDVAGLPASEADESGGIGIVTGVLRVVAVVVGVVVAPLPVRSFLHLDLLESLMFLQCHSHFLQPPLLHIPQAEEDWCDFG